MDKTVKIAVLLSAYNGENYIRQQLDSILQQSVVSMDDYTLKICVRDDGSKDRTKHVLEEYRNRGEIELMPYSVNLGPARSFLFMLQEIEADYYAFSDQDDVWKKDKLSRAVFSLKNITEPAVYYANAELVDNGLRPYGKTVFRKTQSTGMKKILCCCNIPGCTMVINRALRSVFTEIPLPEGQICMHDRFLSMLCSACGGRIIYDPEPVMLYRQHGNNVVGYTVNRTLKSRIRDIFYKNTTSVSGDAENILRYKEHLTKDGEQLLHIIARYKTDLSCRIRLFFIMTSAYCREKDKHEFLTAARVLAGTA